MGSSLRPIRSSQPFVDSARSSQPLVDSARSSQPFVDSARIVLYFDRFLRLLRRHRRERLRRDIRVCLSARTEPVL